MIARLREMLDRLMGRRRGTPDEAGPAR